MSMETQKNPDICIKKFDGKIPLKGELLDVLKKEELVFVRWKKNEIHVMKKSRYLELLETKKAES